MKRNHSLLEYTRDNDTQVSELGPSCFVDYYDVVFCVLFVVFVFTKQNSVFNSIFAQCFRF